MVVGMYVLMIAPNLSEENKDDCLSADVYPVWLSFA